MANLYAIAAGGNWNTPGTWSTDPTKGAAREANPSSGVPTISDTCIIDDYSGAVTVDAATCVCAALDMTGHTAAFTCLATKKLWVHGSITLAAGATYTATGGELTIGNSTTTSTITSAGKTWAGTLIFSGTGTKTLADAMIVTGPTTVSGACSLAGAFTLTTGGLTVSAAFNRSASSVIVSGGTVAGTAAFTGAMSFAGDITVGNFTLGVSTVTYTSGTITASPGATLTIGAATTLNTPTASMAWGNVTITGAITLLAPVTVGGAMYVAATASLVGAHTTTVAGGLTADGALTITDGTLAVTGGMFSMGAVLVGNITFSGTPSIGNIFYGGGVITCTSGATTQASSASTLYISGSCTINTPIANLTWGNVQVTAAATVTLTAATQIARLLTVITGVAATFNTGALLLTGGLALTGTMAGTSVVTMTGGVWTAASAAATLANNMTFGVNAIAKGTVYYKTGTMAYTNGTIHGGLALSIS